ncbi:hypothetical protein NL676_030232 [Syzygium grande]|nr:hypothetical protein NL676_030232 [Syzygium grande]
MTTHSAAEGRFRCSSSLSPWPIPTLRSPPLALTLDESSYLSSVAWTGVPLSTFCFETGVSSFCYVKRKALMAVKASLCLLDWDDAHDDDSVLGEECSATTLASSLLCLYILISLLWLWFRCRRNLSLGGIRQIICSMETFHTPSLSISNSSFCKGDAKAKAISEVTWKVFSDAWGNNLTGTIPDNIGNCTSFEILDIS